MYETAQHCTTGDARRIPDDQPLSRDDLALLAVLASEPTLMAVAETIGRSPRHARRLTRSLLQRMGVASSRTAVAVAAARGCIPEPPSSMPPVRATRTQNFSEPGEPETISDLGLGTCPVPDGHGD